MSVIGAKFARTWTHVGTRFLPFADAATVELPLGRLLRLSLFQVSVGLTVVLLIGTLNRVMIVELGVPAWLVAVMISLPLVFAPFRALVGFRSDTHRSVLGWRRVPYIWMGTLIQFGGSGDHAVRADRAVRRYQRPDHLRPDWRGAIVPAGGRRPAHHTNCWPGPGDRPCTAGIVSESCCPALHDVAARYGRRRPDLRRAARPLHRNQTDPGHPRHRPRYHAAEHHSAVETRGPRSVAHGTRPAATNIQAGMGHVQRDTESETPSVRPWPGDRCLQHAGHSAGTLRRPGAAPDGRHDDDPERAARHRRPERLRRGRSAFGPRHRSLSPRRGRRHWSGWSPSAP